jgi:hypothetical protein
MTTKTDRKPPSPSSDLEILVPEEALVEVAGVQCRVKRIRMRELMLLAKVIANGAGKAFAELDFRSPDFTTQVTAVLIYALPNAHEEFLQLLRAIVEPVEKLHGDAAAEFKMELTNPEAMVGFEVVEIIAVQEHETFRELLGKAKTVLQSIQVLYRKKN